MSEHDLPNCHSDESRVLCIIFWHYMEFTLHVITLHYRDVGLILIYKFISCYASTQHHEYIEYIEMEDIITQEG